MECSRIALLLIFLIFAVPRRSDQSFNQVMSPSPTPLPLTSSGSENAPAPVTLPQRLTCDHVSNKCDIQNCSLTACVPFLGNGSQASYIVVVNGGESSLQLNIVLLPANRTLQGLVVSGHQVMKVNLPSNTRADSSILLSSRDGECTIHLGSLMIPQRFYPNYIAPLHGTYLLFAAALCIGGSWACCKFVRRRVHPDGVLYQELEMEQGEPHSTFATETRQGWGQNWDDEWDDEEKGVRSPGTIHSRKVPLSSSM